MEIFTKPVMNYKLMGVSFIIPLALILKAKGVLSGIYRYAIVRYIYYVLKYAFVYQMHVSSSSMEVQTCGTLSLWVLYHTGLSNHNLRLGWKCIIHYSIPVSMLQCVKWWLSFVSEFFITPPKSYYR